MLLKTGLNRFDRIKLFSLSKFKIKTKSKIYIKVIFFNAKHP